MYLTFLQIIQYLFYSSTFVFGLSCIFYMIQTVECELFSIRQKPASSILNRKPVDIVTLRSTFQQPVLKRILVSLEDFAKLARDDRIASLYQNKCCLTTTIALKICFRNFRGNLETNCFWLHMEHISIEKECTVLLIS